MKKQEVSHNDGGGWTSAPPSVTGQGVAGLPGSSLADAEFIRLPKPRARCPVSGLSRTTLCELLDTGVIKGVTIRKPGALRGIRLIVKQTLLDYLYGLAAKQSTGDRQ